MAIKVFKVGGALLNKSDCFEQLKGIVETNYTSSDKLILIISAFEKTTSNLSAAAVTAEITSSSAAMEILDSIFHYHISIVENIIKTGRRQADIKQYISQLYDKVSFYIQGISLTKELTARTKDLVLSAGEMLASNIVAAYLSEYFGKIVTFDITKVLITDAIFGAATPQLEITKHNIEAILKPVITDSNIVITQGFIASTDSGEITTMGYESSNLSATILAGLIKADEFVIWSDTEGIRQFDPKKSATITPKLIKTIDYNTAEFLAYNGLKPIYPNMIQYLQDFDIEVKFKSGYQPTGEYTTIGKTGEINNKKLIITNDELASYSQQNIPHKYTTNRLDIEKFLLNKNFLEHYNNSIYIAPGEQTFVANKTLPNNVVQTLSKSDIVKQKNICSITLVNFMSKDCLQTIAQLSPTIQDKIMNVFVNYKELIVRILVERDADAEETIMQAFISQI